MQLGCSLSNFTVTNIELCSQNNQIKGVTRFKVDVMTKQDKIFIKCNWCHIRASSINFSLELCSQNDFRYVLDQKIYMVNKISFFSTKRTSSVIFNSHICMRTTLVAIIKCTSLICSLSFWICCIFLKVMHQLISLFSLASHLSQPLGVFVSCLLTVNGLI